MAVLSTLTREKSIHFGLVIGLILSLMKLKRLLKRQRDHPSIIKAIVASLLKYPLFTYLLSTALKNAYRDKTIRSVLFKTFVSSFLIHSSIPIFNNEFVLLLLVRALHSLCGVVIPSDLQPESIYVYIIVHALAYCSVTIWSVYSSNRMWNLFENCFSRTCFVFR